MTEKPADPKARAARIKSILKRYDFSYNDLAGGLGTTCRQAIYSSLKGGLTEERYELFYETIEKMREAKIKQLSQGVEK